MNDLQEAVNEIEAIHEEMKQKMPNIDASSDNNALHNKQRQYPVNPADGFLKSQNIEVIQFPPNDENREIAAAKIKFSVIYR